jgi:hypothetical protein
MSAPKVMHGARGLVYITDPNNGSSTLVGLFNSISYGVTIDVQPAFILGRFSAAELGATAWEPVSISCSGWRVVNSGPHTTARVTRLQDLLQNDYISMAVVDRESGLTIANIQSVRPTGYTTTLTNRQLEEFTSTYMGILVDDESTQNAEPGAADLPTT